MMKISTIIIILFIESTFFNYAQGEEKNSREIELGPGVSLENGHYQGVRETISITPIARIEYLPFYLYETYAGLFFYQYNNFYLSGSLHYALDDGYDVKDSPIFLGMKDRKKTVYLGPSLFYEVTGYVIELSLRRDILGHSKGLKGLLGGSKEFLLTSKITLNPEVGFIFNDNRVMDYYYGVTASEATATRFYYKPHWTLVPFLSINYIQQIFTKLSFVCQIELEFLTGQHYRSPLVKRGISGKMRASSLMGLFYSF